MIHTIYTLPKVCESESDSDHSPLPLQIKLHSSSITRRHVTTLKTSPSEPYSTLYPLFRRFILNFVFSLNDQSVHAEIISQSTTVANVKRLPVLGDNAQQLVVESHRSIQTRSLLPYNTNIVRTVIRESHNLSQSINTTAAPFLGTQGAQPTQGVSAELTISALALSRNKRALYVYHQQRIDTVKDKFWEKGGVASNVFAQGMETRLNMTTFDEAFAKGYSDLCLQFKTSWYTGSTSTRARDPYDDGEDEEMEEEEPIQLMDAVDLFGGGTDLSPPRDLMVDVRVIKDMGEVELLSGNRINLEKGKQYFLPREDVEAMVVSGAVEVVD